MKPNKRKWEVLLEDPTLEKRITNFTETRFRKERNRNRMIASAGFVFVFMVSFFTYTNVITPNDELSSNVGFLLEELDSNPFLYLGGD